MKCNCVDTHYVCINCESKEIYQSLNSKDKMLLIEYWHLIQDQIANQRYIELMNYFDNKGIETSDFDFNILGDEV